MVCCRDAVLACFVIIIHISLVYSIHDPTEVAIRKMIEASEKMTSPHNNPTVNKDLELQIKMLQNASRLQII
jgi:hypothetical protein